MSNLVGVPRIELGLPVPKTGVLPVYDTPDLLKLTQKILIIQRGLG